MISGKGYTGKSGIGVHEFPSLDKEGWRAAPGWFDLADFDSPALRAPPLDKGGNSDRYRIAAGGCIPFWGDSGSMAAFSRSAGGAVCSSGWVGDEVALSGSHSRGASR